MSEFFGKVDKTLRYYRARSKTFLRNAVWSLRQRPAQRPIFVVGCSRAGTTLVYKTLSQSREIGSLQRETHDFWMDLHPLRQNNWNTHGLGAVDASAREVDHISRYFYSRTGHHRWVDKNNQNGLCVPYLQALFPDAVFVYVKRSPGDNLNSLIEGWGKPQEFATWSDQLPERVDIDGRYKKWCFFLADGWREYLDRPIEEVCAFQYQAINQAILDARQNVGPEQWVDVYYEDFLRDPVETFRKLFQACGLQFDSMLEGHCAEVLDIPYNAFSEIRLDKWKDGRNRDKVARALPLVAAVAGRMGYALT